MKYAPRPSALSTRPQSRGKRAEVIISAAIRRHIVIIAAVPKPGAPTKDRCLAQTFRPGLGITATLNCHGSIVGSIP